MHGISIAPMSLVAFAREDKGSNPSSESNEKASVPLKVKALGFASDAESEDE